MNMSTNMPNRPSFTDRLSTMFPAHGRPMTPIADPVAGGIHPVPPNPNYPITNTPVNQAPPHLMMPLNNGGYGAGTGAVLNNLGAGSPYRY